MNNQDHYFHDHVIAKIAVYIGYVTVGVGSIESGNPYLALVLGTALWLFGINSVAYCVETIRGHEHNHKLI
ncbi:MAG: hypothetical protein RIC89_21735 [Pseudomonadales bacterium]